MIPVHRSRGGHVALIVDFGALNFDSLRIEIDVRSIEIEGSERLRGHDTCSGVS